MLNFLLWLISLQARFVDKLIRLANKNNTSYSNKSSQQVPTITYFCWCLTDQNEIVGNPAVISARGPQAAAAKYYLEHLPEEVKEVLLSSGRTLTTLSRPVGTGYKPDTNVDYDSAKFNK